MSTYGMPPLNLGHYLTTDLKEMMYYLYLPIVMREEGGSRAGPATDIRLPPNLENLMPLVRAALQHTYRTMRFHRYVYISARKGWATPDNPLNRPGWHCDGFGTEDLNFVWWRGAGTRFWVGDPPIDISKSHIKSLDEFEAIARQEPHKIQTPPPSHLYLITPTCIHATPVLERGEMRQYVKISCSNHRYNLADNSHNYMFDYIWDMHDRSELRNDTDKAQRDYV